MYLIISERTKNITVNVFADKQSRYYVTESNDIKVIDRDYVLHELQMIKDAKKVGLFNIYVTSISLDCVNKIIERDNKFINKNARKITTGGIFAMLKNKGYK